MGKATRAIVNIGELDQILHQALRSAVSLTDPQAQERLQAWALSNLRNYVIHELDQVNPVSSGAGANASGQAQPQWMRDAIAQGRGARIEISEELIALLRDSINLIAPMAARRPITRVNASTVVGRAMLSHLAKQACGSATPSLGRSREHALALVDGREWRWVELLDATALAHEGLAMRHCCASYQPELAQGSSRFFSLRDPEGRSKLTAEVASGRLAQIRGRAQCLPKARYWGAIAALLSKSVGFSRIDASECQDLLDAGCLYISATHACIPLAACGPGHPGLCVKGDLRVSEQMRGELPEGLRVEGRMILKASSEHALPEQLFAKTLHLERPARFGSRNRFGLLALKTDAALDLPASLAHAFDLRLAPNARVIRASSQEPLRALTLPPGQALPVGFYPIPEHLLSDWPD